MATYVRLMAFKQRPGWGHETLMREVSDSLHLRRFCLIGSGERAPDESTVVEADVCYRFGGCPHDDQLRGHRQGGLPVARCRRSPTASGTVDLTQGIPPVLRLRDTATAESFAGRALM